MPEHAYNERYSMSTNLKSNKPTSYMCMMSHDQHKASQMNEIMLSLSLILPLAQVQERLQEQQINHQTAG